jgi:hypothetical protein
MGFLQDCGDVIPPCLEVIGQMGEALSVLRAISETEFRPP